jgi:hypothetical protein
MKTFILVICFLNSCQIRPQKSKRTKNTYDFKEEHTVQIRYKAKDPKKFFQLFPSNLQKTLSISLVTIKTKPTDNISDYKKQITKALSGKIGDLEIEITGIKKMTHPKNAKVVIKYEYNVTSATILANIKNNIDTEIKKLDIHKEINKNPNQDLLVRVDKDPIITSKLLLQLDKTLRRILIVDRRFDFVLVVE